MVIRAHQNPTDSLRTDVGEIDTRAPFQSVKAAVSLFAEGPVSPDRSPNRSPGRSPNRSPGRKSKTLPTEVEVGEIDTRAPFESVKAAVSLFGVGATSPDRSSIKKSRAITTERVLAKETQLHLAEKELNKFKAQLKNAETTKIQALAELEKAKRTAEELTQKLKTLNESKESAIKATESAKNQARQLENVNSVGSDGGDVTWKQDLEIAREQYAATMSELDAAKQELRKIRQDFEASRQVQATASLQVETAEHAAEANKVRVGGLSKEIATIQDSLVHVKLACLQAQEEHAKILSEKDAQRHTSRSAIEEAQKKLESLKKDFDPEMGRNLAKKLEETTAEIGTLQREIENARNADLDAVKSVTSELDNAKGTLEKLSEEGISLKNMIESLRVELENVKKEHLELKEKEAEAENLAGNLHIKLQKSKAELEAAVAAESKARGASDELIFTIQQLCLETENARQDVETMKKTAEELKIEAIRTRGALEETEKNLQVSLKEAEEAKAAEANALNRIKMLSEKANAARRSTSESSAQITISAEEYESLSRKVEESNALAEMKVAAAIAHVEAVKASENESLKKLEVVRKEIKEMEAATEEALKRAEMAEAAKKAVEGELRRWREREQKRAAEVASRILAETATSTAQSPVQARIVKPNAPEKTSRNGKHQSEKVGNRKVEKAPGHKKALFPNLSGIFQRKKNQVEGGSPSYLPGEKPV